MFFFLEEKASSGDNKRLKNSETLVLHISLD